MIEDALKINSLPPSAARCSQFGISVLAGTSSVNSNDPFSSASIEATALPSGASGTRSPMRISTRAPGTKPLPVTAALVEQVNSYGTIAIDAFGVDGGVAGATALWSPAPVAVPLAAVVGDAVANASVDAVESGG